MLEKGLNVHFLVKIDRIQVFVQFWSRPGNDLILLDVRRWLAFD